MSQDRLGKNSQIDWQVWGAAFSFNGPYVERQQWNLAITKITTGQVMFDQKVNFRRERLVMK